MIAHRGPRRRVRLCALRALAVVVLAVGFPRSAHSELRPLVRQMLENLGAVNQIGEGVALGDYDDVASAARDLKKGARRLKKQDLEAFGLSPTRGSQFVGYLRAQGEAADEILKAAEREDGRGALRGVKRLFRNSCIPCHSDFREANNLLSPAVLFMTTFLRAWQDINRGIAVNDLALVGRSAQELASMSRVLSWDQVIENTFDLDDPEDRRDFRKLVSAVSSNAVLISTAAGQDDKLAIVVAAQEMWSGGCIACHERFRDIE